MLLALVLSMFGGPLFAGTLAVGTVVRISNISFDQDQFAVWIAGTGPCATADGSMLILFPVSAAKNADSLKRAYANALTAYSLGKPVFVYNYVNSSCAAATFIEICTTTAACG